MKICKVTDNLKQRKETGLFTSGDLRLFNTTVTHCLASLVSLRVKNGFGERLLSMRTDR